MAEELQGLLNRIQSDGLKKAEEVREKILTDAKNEAERLVAEAKAEAQKIVSQAKAEAESSEAKAQAVIRQASRDVILALRSDLQEKLRSVVKWSAGEAMTPDFMAKIIGEMAAAFGRDPASAELILPAQDAGELENRLKSNLAAAYHSDPKISFGSGFSSGLKINFNGSDEYLDFSDEAIADVICEFVGPKLAALIKD